MKSKFVEKFEMNERRKFPKLMIMHIDDDEGYQALIVLFTRLESGVVVVSDKMHPVGYTSDGWCMDSFENFYGKITIKQ